MFYINISYLHYFVSYRLQNVILCLLLFAPTFEHWFAYRTKYMYMCVCYVLQSKLYYNVMNSFSLQWSLDSSPNIQCLWLFSCFEVLKTSYIISMTFYAIEWFSFQFSIRLQHMNDFIDGLITWLWEICACVQRCKLITWERDSARDCKVHMLTQL